MTIKEEVFKMLDEEHELAEITEKLALNPNTAVAYKQEWKRERGIKSKPAKNSDELADAIFGKDDKQKEQKPKKHFVADGQATAISSLKLESETRVYDGKYGKYTITDGMVSIELKKESVVAVDKPSLAKFAKEIEDLGGLM